MVTRETEATSCTLRVLYNLHVYSFRYIRVEIRLYKNIFYTYTLSEDGLLLYVNLTLYFLPVTLTVLVCRFRLSSDDLQSLQVVLTLHHDIFV